MARCAKSRLFFWRHTLTRCCSSRAQLRFAIASEATLTVHRLSPAGGDPSRTRFALPEGADKTRSLCYLQNGADRLAVTGDHGRGILHLIQLGEGGVKVLRKQVLASPGVAVRTHAREPQQLMLAEDDGRIHFLDLRVPDGARAPPHTLFFSSSYTSRAAPPEPRG